MRSSPVKPAAFGNLVDSVVVFLECPPCDLDAECVHRAGSRTLARLCVATGEVAGTHADALGQTLDPEIGRQVLGDPPFQLAEMPHARMEWSSSPLKPT
jgi:hypothetical protein